MNVLDLFSGIGGFSLGLERAGMRTVAFCEIEPFCRAVLRRHWPSVPIYEDVRTLTGARLRADGIVPDVICGGFPCQDISVAGKGAGIEGERSGLWSEYARLIGEVRPRFVLVENVAALLGRGLSRVLGDLATLGFDAEWHCIPASAVGALHRRDRLWLIAHAIGQELWDESGRRDGASRPAPAFPGHDGASCAVADASRDMCAEQTACGAERQRARPSSQSCGEIPDAHDGRLAMRRQPSAFPYPLLNPSDLDGCEAWLFEPDVGRVADGVPNRVDRLRSLGNAVVPQIPEIIGRALMCALTEE